MVPRPLAFLQWLPGGRKQEYHNCLHHRFLQPEGFFLQRRGRESICEDTVDKLTDMVDGVTTILTLGLVHFVDELWFGQGRKDCADHGVLGDVVGRGEAGASRFTFQNFEPNLRGTFFDNVLLVDDPVVSGNLSALTDHHVHSFHRDRLNLQWRRQQLRPHVVDKLQEWDVKGLGGRE